MRRLKFCARFSISYLLAVFTDKWKDGKLPVVAYSPSLGCKLHVEPTAGDMIRSVSESLGGDRYNLKMLTWLLELLVPPWGLIASFFTEPSPAFVDNLLSPYQNLARNCDQYYIASLMCKYYMKVLNCSQQPQQRSFGSPSSPTKNRLLPKTNRSSMQCFSELASTNHQVPY